MGNHGRDGYEEPERVKVRIIASIQPLSGEVAQELPEGLRDSASIVIYSTSPLKTVEVNSNYYDILEYGSKTYRIHESKEHDQHAPIPHRRYVGVASSRG